MTTKHKMAFADELRIVQAVLDGLHVEIPAECIEQAIKDAGIYLAIRDMEIDRQLAQAEETGYARGLEDSGVW